MGKINMIMYKRLIRLGKLLQSANQGLARCGGPRTSLDQCAANLLEGRVENTSIDTPLYKHLMSGIEELLGMLGHDESTELVGLDLGTKPESMASRHSRSFLKCGGKEFNSRRRGDVGLCAAAGMRKQQSVAQRFFFLLSALFRRGFKTKRGQARQT
jgi:hypothetical protein